MAQIGSAQQASDGIGTDHPLRHGTDLSDPSVQSVGTLNRIEYSEPGCTQAVHDS